MFLARYWARYAVEADSAWAREIARRKTILGTYHFHESGKVEDNIDGGQITAANWSELIGFGPILCGLEIMAWLPEEFGPARENHLVRSTSPVTSIVYGKGHITYRTFDAPPPSVDVLRVAFRPEEITADGRVLDCVRTSLPTVTRSSHWHVATGWWRSATTRPLRSWLPVRIRNSRRRRQPAAVRPVAGGRGSRQPWR